jgi:DNA-binding response OmpR family regulator
VRILLVEDDDALATVLASGFAEHGHETIRASTAGEGRERATSGRHDVIILDVMLPGGSGFDLCRELRRREIATPILMLTARDAVPDRVRGLDAGADDYLTKPFALEELLARVRALGRRAGEGTEDKLVVGELVLDLARHEVRRGDQTIELTAKEFDLLAYLMRNSGRVLSKDQITEHVWGYDSQATSNVVEIYIHYLRDKIDRGFLQPNPRPLIRTVRGVGYTIKE